MDVKIGVALIAAFVSFLGLLISKEQKVSDFRQAWIDRVRTDVAELIGKCSEIDRNWVIVQENCQKNKKISDKFVKDNIDIFRDIALTISRIKLSLNPEKDKEMIVALNNIEEATRDLSEISNLSGLVSNLEKLSHVMFKTEWERVKNGEPFYYASKWLVGSFVIALLAASCSIKI